MPLKRLSVVVTRRLPDAVETRLKELFDAELRDPGRNGAPLELSSVPNERESISGLLFRSIARSPDASDAPGGGGRSRRSRDAGRSWCARQTSR